MNEIQSIRQDLNRMLDIEESMWHQRTHITWLQKGDRNIAFFHTKASSRLQRNTIFGV